MFNGSDLLGSLLQGGGPRGHATGRLEHAMGERGLGGAGGPLGQILGGLGGASASPGHQAAGSGGGILGSLAGMLGGGGSGGLGGALGGTGGRQGGRDVMAGGLGALAASVLSGRGGGAGGLGGGGGGLGGALGGLGGGNMRGAVGAGGLALLGMLAMNALKNAGTRQQPAGPGLAEDPPAGGLGAAYGAGAEPGAQDMPPEQALTDQTASLVVRAMIDAAKADGRVDATERQRILAKAQANGADEEASAFLQRELERPADPDGLAAAARDPVVAAQVYAASLLAIEVDSQEERDYLRALAGKLNLGPQVVAQLHSVLGAPLAA